MKPFPTLSEMERMSPDELRAVEAELDAEKARFFAADTPEEAAARRSSWAEMKRMSLDELREMKAQLELEKARLEARLEARRDALLPVLKVAKIAAWITTGFAAVLWIIVLVMW